MEETPPGTDFQHEAVQLTVNRDANSRSQGDPPNKIPLDSLPDDDLIAQVRSELPYITTAFEEILRRYESPVFRTAYRRLGDREDAEEVTQNVFLRVFHFLKSFAGQSTFRTWLFRIVRNQCSTKIDKLRKVRETKQKARERLITSQGQVSPGASDRGTQHRLTTAMALLTEDEREILVLRYVSDLSLSELSEVLECDLSAAKMRLYRATDRLKRFYESVGESGP